VADGALDSSPDVGMMIEEDKARQVIDTLPRHFLVLIPDFVKALNFPVMWDDDSVAAHASLGAWHSRKRGCGYRSMAEVA